MPLLYVFLWYTHGNDSSSLGTRVALSCWSGAAYFVYPSPLMDLICVHFHSRRLLDLGILFFHQTLAFSSVSFLPYLLIPSNTFYFCARHVSLFIKMSSRDAMTKSQSLKIASTICWNTVAVTFSPNGSRLNLYDPRFVLIVSRSVQSFSNWI